DRAAVSSRQPVGTSRTIPEPSRYFATKNGLSSTSRSVPSLPTVTGAVRVLFLLSFQRAKRWPFLANSSASAGIGFVYVFLKTVPIVLPFPCRRLEFQAEKLGQLVRQIQAKRRFSPQKAHDACSLDPGLPFKGNMSHPALLDRLPQDIRHCRFAPHVIIITGDAGKSIFFFRGPRRQARGPRLCPLWDEGRPRPQETAQNVPSNRGAPVPRVNRLWQAGEPGSVTAPAAVRPGGLPAPGP